MQAMASKRPVASILTLIVLVAGLTLSGCHSERQTAAGGTGQTCPVCQTEMRVMPLTGLTYTISVCPECKRVSTLDASTRAAVEAYTGGPIGDTVYVCDQCEAIIESCAVCREK
jgi:ssDNA-binding Zn-finger/Zn-ribbon topoisomerase 1